MFSLITPTVDYEQSYRSYYDELGNAERCPFTLDFEFDDFPAQYRRSSGDRLNYDHVPDKAAGGYSIAKQNN